MKLLVVSDYAFPDGGIEQFVREFLKRATERYECYLLTWDRTALVPSGFNNVITVQMGDVRGAWSAMDIADVIMVITSFNVRLLASLAQQHLAITNTPAIVVVQTSDHSHPDDRAVNIQNEWLMRLIAQSTVVAVSDDVLAALRELEQRLDGPTRMVVIENGARLFTDAHTERSRRSLLFIGRPHPQKGFPLFERLAEDLVDSGLEFHANTVWVSPARQIPHVQYTASLDDRELVALFARADLLVAPYLRGDGWPLALLEALNCGVPILGFDSPGVGSLLRRYGQAVVEPTYSALLDAVLAWKAGLLSIQPPSPGLVPTWDVQIGHYLTLLSDLVGGQHKR